MAERVGGAVGRYPALERTLRRWVWRAWRAPTWLLERSVRSRRLSRRVRHVFGPEHIDYGPDEVLAICVVRNGSVHIRSFLEHHFRLGVRHIVFLDNGSTDDTIDIACEYPNVTVLACDLPYRRYENVMKRYLAMRFSRGRWNLCVDVDELFDYPFSARLALPELVAYLNRYRFTALLTHMLDMFADETLADPPGIATGSLREAYRFYDTSHILTSEYTWSAVPDPRIRMHWGGIRKALFGTNNGLTKAALVRMVPGVEPFVDWHQVSNARVADVTGVLLHYPFVGSFHSKVADAVATGRYGYRTTDEYRRYWRALRQESDFRVWSDAACELTDLDRLLEEGFLVASPAFRERASTRPRQR